MRSPRRSALIWILILVFGSACDPTPEQIAQTVEAEAVVAVRQTLNAMPTWTPAATSTARPTYTPRATFTPAPTQGLQATLTPRPSHTPRPTLTPEPTWTPPPVAAQSQPQAGGEIPAVSGSAPGLTIERLFYSRGLMRDVINASRNYIGEGRVDYQSEGNYANELEFSDRPVDCNGVVRHFDALLASEVREAGSENGSVQGAYQNYRAAFERFTSGVRPLVDRCRQAVNSGETLETLGDLYRTGVNVLAEVEPLLSSAVNQLQGGDQ